MESGALASNLHMGKDMTLPGERQPFSPENNLAQLLMQAHANGKREAYEDAATIAESLIFSGPTLTPYGEGHNEAIISVCAAIRERAKAET